MLCQAGEAWGSFWKASVKDDATGGARRAFLAARKSMFSLADVGLLRRVGPFLHLTRSYITLIITTG